MERTQLRQSGVVFNEESHTYTLDGRQLQGITRMIKEVLFPDMYGGISESVLQRAQEYGSGVHKEIERYINGESVVTEAVATFSEMLGERGLRAVAAEYTVTDGEYFASNIDVVTDDCSLCDIKTTSTLHEEYVSWQLSIYAMMFELQNPGVRAGDLYAIWIPNPRKDYGRPKMVKVERKSKEDIDALMVAYLTGGSYTPVPKTIDVPTEIVAQIGNLERRKKEIERQQKELHEAIKEQMLANGVKKWETDYFTATVTPAGTRQTIDSKKLKAEQPDIYNKYMKTSETQPSLRITLKDTEI